MCMMCVFYKIYKGEVMTNGRICINTHICIYSCIVLISVSFCLSKQNIELSFLIAKYSGIGIVLSLNYIQFLLVKLATLFMVCTSYICGCKQLEHTHSLANTREYEVIQTAVQVFHFKGSQRTINPAICCLVNLLKSA